MTGTLAPVAGGSWCPGDYLVYASSFIIDVGPEGGFDHTFGVTRLRVHP